MGWRLWSRDKTEAQVSLERLQTGAAVAAEEPADPQDLIATIDETPSTNERGVPLACTVEAGVLRVGEQVILCTTFRVQITTVVALQRGGVAVQELGVDEQGKVTLADDADLTDVHRSSELCPKDPDDDTDGDFSSWLSDHEWRLEVRTAEQRGRHAYVTGPAYGEARKGALFYTEPDLPSEAGETRIKQVETLADGSNAVLLSGITAAVLQYGDQICSIGAR